MLLFLEAIKPTELILIVVVALLFFGGKKIPELMKGIGQGIKEFKDASKGGTDKDSTVKKEDENKGQLK